MNPKHNGMPDRDDHGRHGAHNESNTGKEHHLTAMNEDVAGNDLTEENRENRKHHQEHGNRKYRMFSNHSSSDDQPMTNTDTTP